MNKCRGLSRLHNNNKSKEIKLTFNDFCSFVAEKNHKAFKKKHAKSKRKLFFLQIKTVTHEFQMVLKTAKVYKQFEN